MNKKKKMPEDEMNSGTVLQLIESLRQLAEALKQLAQRPPVVNNYYYQVPAPVMPHTKVDTEEKQPQEEKDDDDSLAVVRKCFKFTSEFTKGKVEAVVKEHYLGIAANLALIEAAFFDHNLLKKRNGHTPLLRALVAWEILDQLSEDEIKRIAGGMAYKMHALPACGYMEWDGKAFVNDKKVCEDIGKELTPSIPYNKRKGSKTD